MKPVRSLPEAAVAAAAAEAAVVVALAVVVAAEAAAAEAAVVVAAEVVAAPAVAAAVAVVPVGNPFPSFILNSSRILACGWIRFTPYPEQPTIWGFRCPVKRWTPSD